MLWLFAYVVNSSRAPATVIITMIRIARPRATLSLNVIPRFLRVRARLAFLSPLSGVGGGGVYIDRTVDKMSFVIQDYQTQYFGRLHRNHDNDATLIENSFLL